MARRTYSGLEICKVLEAHGYEPVGGRGSHRRFVYIDPNTAERRTVTVPLHDELATGTLKSIMEQAGGEDLGAFLDWIEANS
jgi:predicted RNA binding protein YcfA (HicA-like mRNA interferase family)